MVVQISTTMVVDREKFIAVAHRVVWCTVATVDRRGRPRSRILHPYWELTRDGLVGWVTTRPTPLKVAHLEHSPYVSCSYWDPQQDTAVAECHAEWVGDLAAKRRVWELFRTAPEPLGHDPGTIWPQGPDAHDAGVLKLTPWRLKVLLLRDVAPPPPPRAALR
jgi:general stress protein 26